MRLRFIFILGLFFLSFASSASTEAETTFTIGGCSFNYGDDIVGVVRNSCSVGEAVGQFYCDNDANPWITTEPGYGCSMGRDEYVLGASACCPEGHFCEETDDGFFQCQRATEACVDFDDSETGCLGSFIGCTWLAESRSCVQFTTDEDCGYWKNESACLADTLNIGKVGVGTDVYGKIIKCGGKTISISESESSCIWDVDTCKLNYVAKPMYSPEGAVLSKLSCSSAYTLGECIDGKQEVVKDATVDNPDNLPLECIKALGCEDGTETRFCGESTTKLPGFSMFSFLVSLAAIGIFYFFAKR